MNTYRLCHISLAAALLLAGRALAEEWVKYEGQPGSKIKIDGTSTIHEWTVESQIIGGALELETNADADLKGMKVKPKVDVSIPVRSLKSGKKSMDNVMYEHMKQATFPKIEYKLLDLKPAAGGDALKFDATGALTVAGVTKTNTMPVTFERPSPDKLKVTGKVSVKMTDFGIKPPAPDIGLGLIKTGDDVKITFEWLTGKAAAK